MQTGLCPLILCHSISRVHIHITLRAAVIFFLSRGLHHNVNSFFSPFSVNCLFSLCPITCCHCTTTGLSETPFLLSVSVFSMPLSYPQPTHALVLYSTTGPRKPFSSLFFPCVVKDLSVLPTLSPPCSLFPSLRCLSRLYNNICINFSSLHPHCIAFHLCILPFHIPHSVTTP